MATPHLRYAGGFILWCMFTLAIRRPAELVGKSILILVCLTLYVIMATGVQSVKNLQRMLLVVFSCGLFVAFVGAHQGLSPFQCVVYNPADKNSVAFADGRECAVVDEEGLPHDGTVDCMESGKAGMAYDCERAGLFGTTSCGGGRVRYLGVLLDPNELSLATAIAIPFAFALLEMRWSFMRILLLIGTLATVGLEIVFTQSRGGQVTMGAVLGAYFIKQYGWKRGAMVGAMLAIPCSPPGRAPQRIRRGGRPWSASVLRGGRHPDADGPPLRGVGYGLYTESHSPHRAQRLRPRGRRARSVRDVALRDADLHRDQGCPSPWSASPWTRITPTPPRSKTLGMAMLAAMIGLSIGVFFLSWCYHYVLWMHWAMCGALYCTVKRIYPDFQVTVTRREKGLVFAGYVVFLVVWTYYIRSKGAWD